MTEENIMNSNNFKEADVKYNSNTTDCNRTKNDVDIDKSTTTEIHWIESEFMKKNICSTNTKKCTTIVGIQAGDEEHDDNKYDDEDDNDIECFDLFIDPDPKQVFNFQWKIEQDDNHFINMNSKVDDDPIETTTVVDSTRSIDENDETDDDHHHLHGHRNRQQQTNTNTTTSESSTTNSGTTTTIIEIALHGMKQELGQTLHSTGLTLWRASEILCNFMVKERKKYIQNRTVLELGAGLGICGILAYKLGASSVILTDGDTDTLANMQTNVQLNCSNKTNVDDNSIKNQSNDDDDNYLVNIAQKLKPIKNEDFKPMQQQQQQYNDKHNTITCQQLIWGNEKQIESFVDTGTSARHNNNISTSRYCHIDKQQLQQEEEEQQQQGQSNKKSQTKFDTIIGSDIIYVEEILHPLFSTVYQLLQGTNTGHFLLSYARRNVSIDLVFATASIYHMKWEEIIDPITSEGVFIFTLIS